MSDQIPSRQHHPHPRGPGPLRLRYRRDRPPSRRRGLGFRAPPRPCGAKARTPPRPTFWIAAFIIALAALPRALPSIFTATDGFCRALTSGPASPDTPSASTSEVLYHARVVVARASVSVDILHDHRPVVLIVTRRRTRRLPAAGSTRCSGASPACSSRSAAPRRHRVHADVQDSNHRYGASSSCHVRLDHGASPAVPSCPPEREFVTAARSSRCRSRIPREPHHPNSMAPASSCTQPSHRHLHVSEAPVLHMGIGLPTSEVISWGAGIVASVPCAPLDGPVLQGSLAMTRSLKAPSRWATPCAASEPEKGTQVSRERTPPAPTGDAER